MAGQSRATSPIPNCGPSAITARPGSTICASATALPSPNARSTSAPTTTISAPIRYASAACWSARSARCASKKTPPTAPPPKSCRSRPPRAAAAIESAGYASSLAPLLRGEGWGEGRAIRECCEHERARYPLTRIARAIRPLPASGERLRDDLLPVVGQHLVAGLAEAGAVLLQAGEHHLIAVIHDRAAVPRHVACAGVVAGLLLLRPGSRRQRGRSQNDKRNNQNKSGHLALSSETAHPCNQIPASCRCQCVTGNTLTPRRVPAASRHPRAEN